MFSGLRGMDFTGRTGSFRGTANPQKYMTQAFIVSGFSPFLLFFFPFDIMLQISHGIPNFQTFPISLQLIYSSSDSKGSFLSSSAQGMWRQLCTIPALLLFARRNQMIHIASLVLDSLESLNQGVCVREKAAMLMGWEIVLIPGQALRTLVFSMSEQSYCVPGGKTCPTPPATCILGHLGDTSPLPTHTQSLPRLFSS